MEIERNFESFKKSLSASNMPGDGSNQQCIGPGFSTTLYSFRLSGLIDRRDLPVVGEVVRFQPIKSQGVLSHHGVTSNRFLLAGMVVSMKRCLYARVESIKGQVRSFRSLVKRISYYEMSFRNSKKKFVDQIINLNISYCCFMQTGTLNYELASGGKLVFSISDVITSDSVQPGDLIEFVGVVKNNKFTAVGLHKVWVRNILVIWLFFLLDVLRAQNTSWPHSRDKQQRPDRLVSRLKGEDLPRITTLRAPRGPDGTRGFNIPRRTAEPISAASWTPATPSNSCDWSLHTSKLAELYVGENSVLLFLAFCL